MKIHPQSGLRAVNGQRGAALMMAMLVLVVLILIASQIRISTITDSRIARNQTALSHMDLAIESAFLKVFEDLKNDAEADAGGADGGGGGGLGAGGAGGGLGAGGAGAGAGGGGGATDSSRDDWAKPRRTEINELQMRVYHQDEDSKYNILNMLTEDEDEALKARERVARILDLCREGTEEDIGTSEADAMAEAMLDHMQNRGDSDLPQPVLLTDDEDDRDLGLPMTLREFVVLPEFDQSHFRDYRDHDGERVHSIGSFLTLWTSLTPFDELNAEPSTDNGGSTAPSNDEGSSQGTSASGNPLLPSDSDSSSQAGDQGSPFGNAGQSGNGDAQGAGAQGTGNSGTGNSGTENGGAPQININRAPVAVLKALMDDRDVPMTFWDDVLRLRNEEDEEQNDQTEDPPLDEFGNEIIIRRIFGSDADLAELDGWDSLEPIVQAEIRQLVTVKSDVFSIFITARARTGESNENEFFVDEETIEEGEQQGLDLMRTVRCVVWRRTSGEDVELIPLVRWEVLDYVPLEVWDYPDEHQ